mmetsp:Transcript_40555/g.63325  ORF Transcript_40555/g.63325 Transcript_40555/m.63325 type:complete len:83 (+) Transcript_40555:398-646(+)
MSDGDAQTIFVKKRCNTCGGKKNKKTLSVSLYGAQKDFIEETKTKYNVKSTDKVLRCILEFAQRDGDSSVIFNTTRCRMCGP